MIKIALSIILIILLSACSDELSRPRPYVLTTATTGGTYYPVGVAIATIAHSQLSQTKGISMTAISSAGSLENVKLLRDNQAQFGILQGPFGAWSWSGEGRSANHKPICAASAPYGKMSNISSCSPAWQKRGP